MNNTIFDAYFKRLVKDANADLPHEKLAVIEQMRAALYGGADGTGIVPVALGVNGPELARFNVSHPIYEALLGGEQMAIHAEGGITPAAQQTRQKIAIFIVATVATIGMVAFYFWWSLEPVTTVDENAPVAAAVVTDTVSLEPTVTPTLQQVAASLDIRSPTATPQLPEETNESNNDERRLNLDSDVTDARGQIASDVDEPISIEFGGDSHLLAVGTVNGSGRWNPRSAEWLADTSVRRVIAIPHTAETVTALEEVEQLTLRLRSGAVVIYDNVQMQRVRRDQIEFLTSEQPSIVIILHGEDGDLRTIVTGEWSQQQ